APSGSVYQAGTLSGNPLAMAAGLATLNELTPAVHDAIVEKTQRLVQGLHEIGSRHRVPLTADFAGSMWGFFFRAEPVRSAAEARPPAVGRSNRFYPDGLDRGLYPAPSASEAGFMSPPKSARDGEEPLARRDAAMAAVK